MLAIGPGVLGPAPRVWRVVWLVAGLALAVGFRTPSRADDVPVTEENVEDAIQRAANWIESQRNAEGHWETGQGQTDRHWAGTSGLAVLALLYTGRDPRETALDGSLEWLASQELNGTYTYGVRAHALALVPGKRFRARLQGDLDWLLKAVAARGTPLAGSYDYVPPTDPTRPVRWDNSVSQFGVLGVWAAADAGLEVPESYWEIVAEHWKKFQNPDGGWGYTAGDSHTRGSLTAAGLAALFVVLDQRYAERPKEAGGLLTAISLGLDWFGREYTPENPHGSAEWRYYYLYGVERVGAASGRKYFRNKEWFRIGAAYLLGSQKPDGSWASSGGSMSELRNTAFALMTLCHGRAPLLFNKLEHGNDWDLKLRDAAGLTRYAGRTLERVLNWQIVRLDGTLDDLLEAPVLYLCGEAKWEFNEVEVQKIREYCQRGGLVFGVAGKDSDEFRQGFETLAQRALPEYPLRPVPAEHPLLSGEVQFAIEQPPALLEVHNGVRMLMLLSTRDVAQAWNRYVPRGRLELDFQLALNVYLLATDKMTIRSRLQTPNIPLKKTEIARTLRVARIKYDGRWDVEPYGWTRLATYMNNVAATRLLVTSGITFDSPELKEFNVAHITGAESFALRPEEVRGLREFLSAGGTLIADAAGGGREFTRALEAQVGLAAISEPRALPAEAPVLTGTGIPGAVDLAGVSYRRAARSAARGQEYPRLMTFQTERRFMVIYSPLDLSAGLLGTPVYNVQGYDPDSALRIMRNLLLYAGLPSADKARLERN